MAKKILFLMSDTGGGHRAAAEAIRDAMYQQYGEEEVSVAIVDVFRQCTFPLEYMPEFYAWIIKRSKKLWGLGYHLGTPGPNVSFFSTSMYLTNRSRLRRVVSENPADVVVNVHSILARPMMSAYLSFPERPPFVTVVTDLVTTPTYWYDKRLEKCFVPTQAAYDRGLKYGLQAEQMSITGLPVHPKFSNITSDKAQARQQLGWNNDLPVVLMVSGGDGASRLDKMAKYIDEHNLDCQLAIIAGKNATLKANLEGMNWNRHPHIYGFVKDMPVKMTASDILITKAGPATICEGCITGLPIIISDFIPGQEYGNVHYVIENDVGVYAPSYDEIVDTLQNWLADKPGLQARSENARNLGRPDAVQKIASGIWEQAQRPPIEKTLIDDF